MIKAPEYAMNTTGMAPHEIELANARFEREFYKEMAAQLARGRTDAELDEAFARTRSVIMARGIEKYMGKAIARVD
jgi:hypothetical protein